MIVEDEHDIIHENVDFEYDAIVDTSIIELSCNCTNEIMEFIQIYHQIRDKQTHM